MRHEGGRLAFAATDLSNHVACVHLTGLRRAVARGELARPTPYDDPRAEVLRQRGIEREQGLLRQFAAEGRTVETVTSAGVPFAQQDRAAAAARTVDAMRRGAGVVYQGRLEDGDGRWSGYPDFLIRVERPSALGEWSYEVVDAKLAREARGTAVLQLLLYSDLLQRAQGAAPVPWACPWRRRSTASAAPRWPASATYCRQAPDEPLRHARGRGGPAAPRSASRSGKGRPRSRCCSTR